MIVHEAIMTPAWQRVADHKHVRYLDVGSAATDAFAAWEWPTATVPAGYLPTLDRDLTALEFSDFLVMCHAHLADDVAGLIAWCMVATRDALEAQYRHIPPDRSPVTYPLQLADIARAPIPLHPAAESAYAALGGGRAPGALIWD